MNVEWVRSHCLSFAHTTEHVQWGNDLVFKVGGKMFAVMALEPSGTWISFKVGPDEFAELIERPSVIPAPYLARASWVALEHDTAMPRSEVRERLRTAYEMVFAKLPKKTRDLLAQPAAVGHAATAGASPGKVKKKVEP